MKSLAGVASRIVPIYRADSGDAIKVTPPGLMIELQHGELPSKPLSRSSSSELIVGRSFPECLQLL